MPTAEYARDLLRAALRRPAGDPDFCVDISETLGRYWLSLLQPLTTEGRSVAVVGALPESDYHDPHGLGRLPLQLPRVTFARRPPRRTASTVLLTDGTSDRLRGRRWAKVLRLSTATETPIREAGTHYRVPFPMFPKYVAKGWEPRFVEQRTAARTTRVLFAGNTDRHLYDELTPTATRRQHGLELTRCEAIDVLREQLPADRLTVVGPGASDLKQASEGSCADRVLLVASPAFRDDGWIAALGSAEFFLALPGVFMPLSHNVVEAMAAGCVPITPYPGWFDPPLTDGANCLVFTGSESLVAAIDRALTMPATDLDRMRRDVCDYYDTHISPSVVPDRLATLPDEATVFVQTENSQQTATIRRGSVAYPGLA